MAHYNATWLVARHGYHGPDEGQISSRSWREDRAPLLGLLERYRSVGAPRTSATREERAGAEARLIQKIQKGSSGTWGPIPMPANPQVTDAEAKVLAKWILAQK